MNFRIALCICVPVLLISCGKTPVTSGRGGALRPVPVASAVELPADGDFADVPVLAGGGVTPLGLALKDPSAPVQGSDGLPWCEVADRAFAVPRNLADTHCYFVLMPESGGQGLFGGGTRQYSDFVAIDLPKEGGIRFHAEDAKDQVRRFGLGADKVPAGKPLLIEIHPSEKGMPVVLVNGARAGELSPLHHLNHFGVGYVAARYHGKVGEIRFYQKLSAERQADIAFQLKSYWKIPGGVEGVPRPVGALSASTPAVRSGPLTLGLKTEDPECRVLVSTPTESEAGAPGRDHPKDVTVDTGRTWAVSTFPAGKVAGKLAFHVSPDEVGRYAGFCGKSGFFALLHRGAGVTGWKEVAVTIAAKDGMLHFPPVEALPGEYSLSIVQGVDMAAGSAVLTVNGKSGEDLVLVPGTPVVLGVEGGKPGQKLTLADGSTGLKWYEGTVDQFRSKQVVLRSGLNLKARFSMVPGRDGAPGVFGHETGVAAKLDPAADRLYPGLLVQIIRRPSKEAVALPDRSAFIAPARWPEGAPLIDTSDVPFRTADIHPASQPASRPVYFHNVLPSLTITPDPKKTVDLKAIHLYPFNDISKRFPVSARISGFLLPETTGTHVFRWESALAAKVSIGGNAVAKEEGKPAMVEIQVGDLSPLPIELIFANDPDRLPQLDSRLMWKKPGAGEFTVVPAGALLHAVSVKKEKALAKATGAFQHRLSSNDHTHADDKLPAAHQTVKKEDPAYFSGVGNLAKAFLKGRSHSGDPAIARRVFEMIHSRSDWFRAHPDQFPSGPAFGKTYGPDMQLFVTLQPFFSACENHPDLQRESLAARAELSQYAVASCLSRATFAEENHGANDCYNAEHNYAVNFWRAATGIDSPYAWDATTCLFDNHFRITAGTAEGLSADGIFTFHNANGRHVHMSGYGADWFGRIGIDHKRNGTPWAMTPAQYHRLTEYVLAYEWFIYQKTSSFVCNGRHNSHAGGSEWARDRANSLLSLPDQAFSPGDKDRLRQLVARAGKTPGNTISGNRFFYRNLYTVHRRPDFFIDVKMISPLVGGPETFAGGIPWNIAWGDGVTTLMRHGGEYQNIHRGLDNAAYAFGWRKSAKAPNDLALWHYRSLPGSTQLDQELRAPDRYRSGTGETAGGVSDGVLGHCAFHYQNGNAAANHRKMYAFTDDGMAVLTTEIANTSKQTEVHPPDVTFRTNLNQCDWLSDVRVIAQDGKAVVYPLGGGNVDVTFPINQRYWIEHDGIGYLVLPTGAEAGAGKSGTVRLRLCERSPLDPVPGFAPDAAQAALIKGSGLDRKRSAKIFHLSVDHGQKPKDARCAYYVTMRAAQVDAKAWLANPPLRILSNEPELQALADLRDGTTHAFFRKAGELKDDKGALVLSTDRPASLMWRPDTMSLSAQDPVAACTSDIAKMADQLQLTLGTGLRGFGKEERVTVEMEGIRHPDDRYRGGVVTRKF